jgi:hypothetical protein
LKEKDIEVALQKLNQLRQREVPTTAALVLKHTDGLVKGEESTWLVSYWLLNTPPSR